MLIFPELADSSSLHFVKIGQAKLEKHHFKCKLTGAEVTLEKSMGRL
jgi:hypothetical protein